MKQFHQNLSKMIKGQLKKVVDIKQKANTATVRGYQLPNRSITQLREQLFLHLARFRLQSRFKQLGTGCILPTL